MSRLALAAGFVVALAWASGEPVAPQRLCETGLYAGGEPGQINPANRAFSPQYPLW